MAGVEGSKTDGAGLGLVARRAARVAWVGVALGLVLGIAGQIVVAATDAPGTWAPDAGHRIVGALLFGASAGFLLGVVAFVGLRVQGGRLGRGTLVVTAVVAALFAWVHALSTALRVATGSHLTLSGVQYFMNSGTGIAREVASKMYGWLALLVVIGALVGFAVARAIRWAGGARPTGARGAVEAGTLSTMMLGTAVYAIAPVPRSFSLGVRQSTPEIAFVASLEPPTALATKLDTASTKLVERSLVSPPLSAGPLWVSAATGVGRRPNIVLITVEATNIKHLGYEGYARPVTPNLDRLAATSLVAHHAYTTATHSNYAQPAILSSLFPRRGGDLDMYENLEYPRFLLHDAAKALGYTTAVVSSQDEEWQGMKSFQSTGNIDYYHHSPDFHGEHIDIGAQDVVPDGVTADAALAWIDEARKTGKPFELYVNMQATHFPYDVPAKEPHPFAPYEVQGTFNYVHYDRAELPTVLNRYDDALFSVDRAVGKIVDGLAARGLEDDTLLVFVADHGELFWEHDMVTHGRTLWESEAVVPLLIHYPRVIPPAHVDVAVSTLDILPTIAEAMGIPEHPSWQGQSLLPFAQPGRTPQRRDTRHAAVFMNIQGWKHLDGVVCFPYKLVYDPETETRALYDVAADPGELVDLAEKEPKLTEQLASTLHAQIGAQLDYHRGEKKLTQSVYAPRLLSCPE
ncbi:MAG: sulfatase [Polyangiaceae bacterium]